jgi:hypothetical protein
MTLVDPRLSRTKFDREIEEFRKGNRDHQARGWWLLEAEFPEVFIVFANGSLAPPAVIFGAVIIFENYDFWPPSVKIVNPFSRQPYLANQVPTVMKRRLPPVMGPPQVGDPAGQAPQLQFVQEMPLLQAHDPNDVPFVCVPGVREYHEHPAHTGDSWLLRRGRGEGTLYFVLDVLYRYGVQPISSYKVQMIPDIKFGQNEAPE